MSNEQPTSGVNLSSGLPSTVLPDESVEVRHDLAQAADADDPRAAIAAVAAQSPRSLAAWAALAEASESVMDRYAAARVGYHRGLDALRANGWRGSGYVRWAAPSNHGFLRCLLALQRAAAEIGELDEAERCALFLAQLDPSGVPSEFGAIAPVGA
jgi:hypothetical protein